MGQTDGMEGGFHYEAWFVVILVQLGRKEQRVEGPHHQDRFEAEKELQAVREAMKAGSWVDLPWFTGRPESVLAAHLDSASFGFA
jgi:hypothetical protein